MQNSNFRFDVCFVCIGNIANDARTINLVHTLARLDFKICLIAGSENEKLNFTYPNLVFYSIPILNATKAYDRWKHFNKHCNLILNKVDSKFFWATDFYSLYSARKFAIKYNSGLIYDSREIYSSIGALHNRKLKQGIITYFEKKWIKRVTDIVVTGKLDAEYLKEHLSDKHRYSVIMNLPPFSQVTKQNLIRESYNLSSNTLVLIYQGMIFEGRGILPVIRALPFMPDAVFFIIGEGNYHNKIKEEAKKLSVSDRVIIHDSVPYSELLNWTASADIGISFNEPITLSYSLALPNKLFEYCMAGIPSLLSDLPALREINDEYNIGSIVSPDASPEEIASALLNIAKPKTYLSFKENCSKAAKVFCYENQINTILNLITE